MLKFYFTEVKKKKTFERKLILKKHLEPRLSVLFNILSCREQERKKNKASIIKAVTFYNRNDICQLLSAITSENTQ